MDSAPKGRKTWGKREIARYEQFLLFPQYFKNFKERNREELIFNPTVPRKETLENI